MLGAVRKIKPLGKLIRGWQETRAAPGKEGGLGQWSRPSVTLKAGQAVAALSSLAVAVAVSAAAVFAAVVAVAADVVVVAAVGPAGSAAVAAASAVVGVAAPDGTAAPVGAVVVAAIVAAVAAPGQVLAPEKELPGRDPRPVPPAGSPGRGMVSVAQGEAPVKDGRSPGKDRVGVPRAGAFAAGLAAVLRVGGLQDRHGSLSATRRPGREYTGYRNSGHNADHNGGCANKGIFA